MSAIHFFFNLLVSFDVTLKWVSGECVTAHVCACTESGFCGNLVRPSLNKESVFGCRSEKKPKTYLLVCHASPTRLVPPFLRSDGSKVAGCLKAKFRAAYVTPWVPSMQLLEPGVGKHSRVVAAEVKLLTLPKRSSKLKYRSEKSLNFESSSPLHPP